jgi:hypothetical protein
VVSVDDRLPTRLGPGDWVWDDAEQSWREAKDYEVAGVPGDGTVVPGPQGPQGPPGPNLPNLPVVLFGTGQTDAQGGLAVTFPAGTFANAGYSVAGTCLSNGNGYLALDSNNRTPTGVTINCRSRTDGALLASSWITWIIVGARP